MSPTVAHYRDHHKMIKAIEKCSLQATFGPELNSTGDLLAKTSNVSSDTTIRASHDSGNNPVEKGARTNKSSFSTAQPHTNAGLLPSDLTNKDGNTHPDHTPNDDIPLFLTNQHGNIPYDLTTNSRGMPAFSTHKDGMTPVRQSNFLGQVPLEIWGQKASYHV